ncbi:MAG: glycosyltransferase family 4 protein [Bacteroidaceae bacterium]|nr:glycosyltransferase family 4 protein [Bacteroidaceae bacterium]
MKILWITNLRLDVSKEGTYGGGWLTSLMNQIRKHSDIELTVCYTDRNLRQLRDETIDGVRHCGIPRHKNVLKYDNGVASTLCSIIDEFHPDIIHAQGTENANAIAAMRERPNYTYVVSIQGLLSRYAEHYVGGVPFPYMFDLTPRDLLHRDGPISKGRKWAKASWYEIEMIEKANYVMARTSWDVACVKHINRDVPIYSDLRVLRPAFYQHEWKLEKCKRHSIFVGASNNQIKGLHFVLQALPLIRKVYPDTHLYISSRDFTKVNSLNDLIRYQTYFIYIKRLIKKLDLADSVTFMGVLNEQKMSEAFTNAHAFILPSVIENSPNTLSEAGVLGVPTVSSYIAGVPDLVEDGVNGFLYAYDEYYIMADRIIKIFDDDELAKKLSRNLREKARKMYSAEKNTDLVYQAYLDIYRKQHNEQV